jgi:adenylate cyclase, class 2
MMLEIEVKVPVKELAEIEKRLTLMNAALISDKVQEDIYMAHPCRDFGVTDQALRLRQDGPIQVLTYKGPKIDSRSKTREEIEFPVPIEQMKMVLERLGFTVFLRVFKQRKEYRLEDIVICLDHVDGLGDFVELEFSGQNADEGLAKIDLLKIRLDLEGNEIRSYLELIMEKDGR